MNRLAILVLLVVTTSSAAQIRDLETLQEKRSQLQQLSDSLMSVRVRLVARVDSLSTWADSLWSQDPESAALLSVRSASRILVPRLRVIEWRLDSLATAGDSLEADLRDSYDWEIARLHGLLTGAGWDEGLFRQLLVFQEEREELGNKIRASQQRFDDEHELAISASDGPPELRQKIEFAQDRVAAVQEEQREITRRLHTVERTVVVMQKYWHAAEELLRLQGGDGDMTRMRIVDRPGGPGVEIVRPNAGPQVSVTRGARSNSAGRDDSLAVPFEAPLLLEGQQLKVRAQELREVEAVLQERINVFHEHLSRILEGGE